MNRRRAALRLALVFSATLAIAACADAPSQPEVLPADGTLMNDGIDGDSTTCRSGYQVINGKVVCNG